MAKKTTRFYCKSCGHEELRWLGQCPGCREWNTFAEVKVAAKTSHKGARGFSTGGRRSETVGLGGKVQPVPLARVASAETNRLPVEPAEVARVLGGGLVEGSVVLLGGEPGVGKSTLLTGLALWWVRQGLKVIYVAGEESPAQIRMRAERLGFSPEKEEGFHILPEVQLESLMETLEEDAGGDGEAGSTVIIADSIQTLHSENIDSFPGSPTQIRYCGGVLADFARRSGHPVFLVGHVTKSGDLAGPKLLEHMVDTVLYFEGSGGGPIRMVRAVKNRFGTTGELAVMEMRAEGLVPVDQAGVLFLSGRRGVEPGSAVCAVKNGSRVFLVEVQALVSTSRYGTPQRVVQGVDNKRVALLAAILEKRAGMDLAGCDIFVKVAGGGRIDDPGADLAIMVALASSLRERPVPLDNLVLGEVGLTGEIRQVADLDSRLREAGRHGFARAILARSEGSKPSRRKKEGMELMTVTSVEEAVALALEPTGRKAGRG
ncbi:MAG: DNA repair protein RadA [Candidatus Krumholzibacteria bacterium]|nr:DNA repair protein RadA [Candidatus Krumholzibacteria bacterium]